jgi:aminoglycoside 6-adenylyltransferase
MMTQENTDLLLKIKNFVHSANDIWYLGLFGSSTNNENLNDEYSDIDLIVVTNDLKKYFEDESWLNSIDEVWMTFTESEPHLNYWERRCVFKNGLDVDFLLIDKMKLISNSDNFPVAKNIFHKTTQMLIDKEDTGKYMEKIILERNGFNFPKQDEFGNLVNDFYYHYLWTYKKCLRGEYWTALQCINRYMKKRTLKMIEWYEHSVHGKEYYTFYDGRYIENWIDKELLKDISLIYSSYGKESILNSLIENKKLFSKIAKATAIMNKFKFPEIQEQKLSKWMDEKYGVIK